MSDKYLAKDLAAVTAYVVGWLFAAFSFAVALGLFIGIVTKVSRLVSA